MAISMHLTVSWKMNGALHEGAVLQHLLHATHSFPYRFPLCGPASALYDGRILPIDLVFVVLLLLHVTDPF